VLIINEEQGIIIHVIEKEKENDQLHQGKLIVVNICLGIIIKEETNVKSRIHVHDQDHVLIQGEININIIRNTKII
jgi:hypothetical protein